MLYYIKRSIGKFLEHSRRLIFGVRDDTFIRERVAGYNFDDARIAESVTLYENAEKAQSDRLKEYGEQLEAKEQYDGRLEEASALCNKQIDFLKLALRDDVDKQRKLFIIGNPRSKKMVDWFEFRITMYDRVLADDTVVTAVGKYNITRVDLEAARQKLIDARNAMDAHAREKAEAEVATQERDAAFLESSRVVDELETICPYALEDSPQSLEKLNIRVYSPGYKPKKKVAAEEPEPQGPQTEPTQSAAAAQN